MIGIERFCHKSSAPDFIAPVARSMVPQAVIHDHRKIGFGSANVAQDLEPVRAGHPVIQKNQIRSKLGDLLETFRPIHRIGRSSSDIGRR